MAAPAYDRLTATDLIFLGLEDASISMHIGAVCIFDAAPLCDSHGALDLERLSAVVEASLEANPRFRQKLTYAPLLNHPVWIDDAHFNLRYHLRHASLPKPGTLRQLKRFTGRLMSQRLDRDKPLWEMWFVDGLEGGRVALVTKIHHCMIDGISGVDVLASILSMEPTSTTPRPKAWRPRPAPGSAELLVDELSRRAAFPVAAARSGLQALREPFAAAASLREAVSGFAEAALGNLTIASDTPLNGVVGPHRRVDWMRVELDAVKTVKRNLGGTINDVVLAMVAGVVRSFLVARHVSVRGIEIRLSMPVNIRPQADRGTLGNRVGVSTIRLPVDEGSPERRLRRVIEATDALKHSHQTHAIELLENFSDVTLTGLPTELARLAARTRAYNLSVTNIPGPPFPVFLLEAPLREIYPLAFLFSRQALTIALLSYNGGLFWGFIADWDAVPDLHDLLAYTRAELKQLLEIAGAKPSSARRKARRRGSSSSGGSDQK